MMLSRPQLVAGACAALSLLAAAAALPAQEAPAQAGDPRRLADPSPAGPAAAPKPADTVDLRPRFVAGRTTRYEVWTLRQQNVTVRFGAESNSMSSQLEIRGQVTWKVERVRPDGSATCVMTIEYLTADLTPAEGQVERNDTRKAAGDSEDLHGLLKAMAGVPLRLEVAADGTVQKVTGTDAVKRRVPDGVDPPDDLDFVETATDLGTLAAAPAEAKPGAAWNTNFAWSHEAGTMHQAMRYTVAGVEDIADIPVATVNGSAKLKLEVDRGKLPKDGPAVDLRLLSGDVTTQVMFDLHRQEAVGRNTLENRQIEARIRLPDQTIVRSSSETIHSQVLRIAEE